MDELQVRTQIGQALQLARGDGTVHGAGSAGVGYRTVDRLERAARARIPLSAVYLLAMHYGVSLHAVLDVDAGRMGPRDLGCWPAGAPSVVATDTHLREVLRAVRLGKNQGTKALARAANVHQSWLVRYEGGEVATDLVRLYRVAAALDQRLADLLPVPFRDETTTTTTETTMNETTTGDPPTGEAPPPTGAQQPPATTPPTALIPPPPWKDERVKRLFLDALRRGDVEGVLQAFYGDGVPDQPAKRMAEYIVEIRRQNVAVIGAADVFVRRTAQGDLQQVIAPVTLSLQDGTLYQIPSGWDKLWKSDRNKRWNWKTDQHVPYVYEPRYDNPEQATVSAEGYLRMNAVAGCSVKLPAQVLVDGQPRENPYIRRNDEGDPERVVISCYVAGPAPLTGNVVVVQYLLDLDPSVDLLHMLSAIMKGRGRPKKTENRDEANDDAETENDQKDAGANRAVFLTTRTHFNEWLADLDPKDRRRWAWTKLKGQIGIAHDLTNQAVIACYDKWIGIAENVVKKAQTVARRNAMKAHPALARHQVYLGASKQAVVPVVGWTAAGGDVDRYARALDAVARGETAPGIEVISEAQTYDADRDRTGERDLDPVVDDDDTGDDTADTNTIDAETIARNEVMAALDDAVLTLKPGDVRAIGYPPPATATVDDLRKMLAAARAKLAPAGAPDLFGRTR